MGNLTGINLCPPPFWDADLFSKNGGYVQGRLCQQLTDSLSCCLLCPMADRVYPDSFNTMSVFANWVATLSVLCCLFLLVSWAALPVEKTNRHYLSVCFTLGVLLMNLGFIIPLAAQPEQCFDTITPHSMQTGKVCGASGTFLLLGGWCGVMWCFLRSFSLHLQICWQVTVGRNFMIFAHAAGWGVPILGIILALAFSGVSFRFGATCHINHQNSLADLWIPLLLFAGATVIITFATFGYCVKVYLASLSDHSASTEGSSLPAYTSSVRTVTPRQAYRRVRRVITLQWRGLAIVLIVIADVIFSVIFVFQDNIVQSVQDDPQVTTQWIMCLIGSSSDKHQCLQQARSLVVNEATVVAVLLLLALNGIWQLFLLGRWVMVTCWIDMCKKRFFSPKQEFVCVDARFETKQDLRSYEMLSKDGSALVTPLNPVVTPLADRKAADYFTSPAGPQFPSRSSSTPRLAHVQSVTDPKCEEHMNPLGMNRF